MVLATRREVLEGAKETAKMAAVAAECTLLAAHITIFIGDYKPILKTRVPSTTGGR
jgi:hypothetical protein